MNIEQLNQSKTYENNLNAAIRKQNGVHYTNEYNILKVISPLFLEELYHDLSICKTEEDYYKLHSKICDLKFLDPACGCGNFLIVTYNELQKLENIIIQKLKEFNALPTCKLSKEQFYGIEIDENAALIAQQNFKNVVCANALTVDWSSILLANECSYIIGNPPYAGHTNLSTQQKRWLKDAYPYQYKIRSVDFCTAWFVIAARYMKLNPTCRAAFVATSSVCQGEQVELLWDLLIKQGIYINFGYQPFKWSENLNDACVMCVIVGFSYQNLGYGYLYNENNRKTVSKVSPYLIDEPTCTIVTMHKTPIINTTKNLYGGVKPLDNNYLALTTEELNDFIEQNPNCLKYIKLYTNGKTIIEGKSKYCLWLPDIEFDTWYSIPYIKNRVDLCKQYRMTQLRSICKNKPWQFTKLYKPVYAIAIPKVTTHTRKYIPITMIDKNVVCNDSLYLMENGELFDYAFLNSRLLNVWVRVTSGKLSISYRFSKSYSYNTFVKPVLNETRKRMLNLIGVRLYQYYSNSEKPIGELNSSMPYELEYLHNKLDEIIESYYTKESFKDDTERLALLIKLYHEPDYINTLDDSNDVQVDLPLNAPHLMFYGGCRGENTITSNTFYTMQYEQFNYENLDGFPNLAESRLIFPRYIKKESARLPVWHTKASHNIDNSVCVIPTNKLIDYAILISRMHWVWIENMTEHTADTYTYSENVYNTFVQPFISAQYKERIEEIALQLLKLSNFHEDWNATLYMELNELIEKCYREESFLDDEERFNFLFKLYLEY